MGYQTFAHTGKTLIKSEDIGSGQVSLRHMDPGLYTLIRMIQLHTHSGVDSPRLPLENTTGFFPLDGFKMVASNGNKYKVTVNTSGALVVTQIT